VTLIDVRFGDLHEPQDFIWIESSVREVVNVFSGLSEEQAILGLWELVCMTEYPDSSSGSPDKHVLRAFPSGGGYLINKSNDEFWKFPFETLGWKDEQGQRYGDCEDVSILLCTLLRAYGISPNRVKVVIGDALGGPHAWVDLNGYDLETTLSSVPNQPWRTYPDYTPVWSFNDVMVEGNITFVKKVDECEKLKKIGALWCHPTKQS